MPYLYRAWIIIFVVLVIAGCQPEQQALPTEIILPELDTPTPEPVVTASPTPRPTLEPTPTPFLGRAVSESNERAAVRAIHALVDAPPVDIYIDDTVLNANMSFGRGTNAIDLIAGEYDLRIVESGRSPDEGILTGMPLSIQAGEAKIILVNGTVDAPALSIFDEDIEPLDTDEARVNFIHAVPRYPDVDPAQDGGTLDSTLAFGQASGSIIVPAGETRLSFQENGQDIANDTLPLRDRITYTFVLIGRADDPASLTTLTLQQEVSGRGTLRVVNAARDTTSVDVYVDDRSLFTDVAFNQVTTRSQIANGVHAISVFPTGADPDAVPALVNTFEFVVNPGDDVSIILRGDASSVEVLPVYEDLSTTPPEFGRMIFVNTLRDAPALLVSEGDGPREDIPPLLYREASDPGLFENGEILLFFQEGSEEDEALVPEFVTDFEVLEGHSYLYLVTGKQDEDPIVFRDEVGVNPEVTVVDEDATPNPFGQTPTRLRVVNAMIDPQFLDIFVNDTQFVSGLAYASGSQYIVLTDNVLTFQIQPQGSGSVLIADTLTLEAPGDYTLYIYGPSFSVRLLMLSDENQFSDPNFVRLRLINLSLERRQTFGFTLAPPSDPALGSLSFDIGSSEDPRPSLPLGAEPIIFGIAGREQSIQVSVFPDTQDILVLDSQRDRIAQILRSVTLEPGMQYDIIVFGLDDPYQTRALFLPFPER